jgi:hypothetical protein
MADENKQPVYESEGQPELDVVTPSTMEAKKKTVSVVKVDADGKETITNETVDDVRSVQLNEKISDTMYQILHPETDAYQVITDPNRRFVTDKDKAKWNQAFDLGASALHYKGAFNTNTTYHQYDVVHVDFDDADCEYILQEYDADGNLKNVDVNGRQFFIYIDNSANAQWPNAGVKVALAPKHDKLETSTGVNQAKWININYEAYLAEHARKVEVTLDSGDDVVNLVYANDFDAEKVDGEQREHAGRYQNLKESKNLQFVPSDSKVLINSESEGYNYTPIELSGANQKIIMRNVVKNLDEEIEVKDTIVLDGETGHITGSIDKALYADVANYYDDGSADNKSDLTIHEKFQTLEKSLTPDGSLFEHLTIVDDKDQEIGTYYPLDTDNNPHSTIKIKQNYNPWDINDLLDQPNDSGKIKEKWLPDTILGAMQYIGTFDASTGNMDVDLRPLVNGQPRPFRTGDYAIVIKQGDLDPSKAAHIPDHDHEDDPTVPSEECFFLVGDWAVYHDWIDDKEETVDPTGWSKIDNVDSVRTVNDQIGNVKTYKGTWSSGVKYYAGDIVSYDTNPTDTTEPSLYLCIKNTFENGTNNNTTPDESECFKIFGKVYTADYGIEITQSDVIQHKFKDSKSFIDSTKINLQDKIDEQDRTITVSHTELVGDDDKNTGHVKQVTTKTFVIPRDTWRPIKLEGQDFLDKEISDTKILNLATQVSETKGDSSKDTRIEIIQDGTTAYFSHTLNKKGVADEHTSGKVEGDGFADDNKLYLGSKFTAPTFEWDKSGHIDAYSKVVFEIPADLVQHEHFKVDSTSGVGVIRSYTLKEYERETNRNRLFVDGYDTKNSAANVGFEDKLSHSNDFILPESQARMTFNGQFAASTLFQVGRKDNRNVYRVVDESAKVNSGKNYVGTDLETTFDSENNKFELADSGVIPTDKTEPAVFSAVAVNKKGITVAGGQILEFGANEGDNPSDSLVIGGLFFRNMGARNKEDDTNSVNYYYR